MNSSARETPHFLTTAAVAWNAVLLLIILGALLPRLPVLGVVGTLLESFFSLHLVLAAIAGVLFAFLARRRGAPRALKFVLTCAILATIGSLVPLIALTRTASHYGANISWLDHLHVAARFNSAPSDQTILYALSTAKISTPTSIFRRHRPPQNPRRSWSCTVVATSTDTAA